MFKRLLNKWFRIYLFFSSICLFLSLLLVGRAVYVIANHLINFGITDDVVFNNPVFLLFLAFLLALSSIGFFSAYKAEKQTQDTIDELRKKNVRR